MKLVTVLMTVMLASCMVPAQAQQKKTFKEKLIHFLDSSNVKNTDPQYIELPAKKWRVVLNSGFDQLDLEMNSHQNYDWYDEVADDYAHVQNDLLLRVKPPVTSTVGLWAGYLGWGFGYSVSLSGNKGINMSFNIATPSNGVNIRVRRFDFDKPYGARYNATVGDWQDTDSGDYLELKEPMEIESFDFDGYWIFNQKRYALAAAYGNSVIQKRSAGSLIAGAMFHYQKFDLSQRSNYSNISGYMLGLGKVKAYQAAIGLGYTYNWVPVRGLLVNAVVMPVIGLWNHLNIGFYKHDPTALIEASDQGLVNPDIEDDWLRFIHPYLDRTESGNGKINVNLDARVSISYRYKDWTFNVMGQGHRFSTKHENTSIKTLDWDIKLSAGLSFDNPFKKKKKDTNYQNY